MLTAKFRQATLNLYSFQEWQVKDQWLRDLALGYYSEKDNQIHVLEDLKNLREAARKLKIGCYKNTPDSYVKCIVIHEYTHFLQWKLGNGKDPLPILPQGVVPLKRFTKSVYQPSNWLIEAEAHYFERRPHLLGILEAIVASKK